MNPSSVMFLTIKPISSAWASSITVSDSSSPFSVAQAFPYASLSTVSLNRLRWFNQTFWPSASNPVGLGVLSRWKRNWSASLFMIEERPLYSEWPQKNAKITKPRQKEEGVFLDRFSIQRFSKIFNHE